MAYVLVGNSIVDRLRTEGLTRISMSGKRLQDMREELDLAGIKIVISGIPDIMASKGADHVDGSKVTEYEEELDRASSKQGVILCPFYPPKSLRPSQWGVVHRLNQRICNLNARKGEGTPALIHNLFGRARNGDLYFESDQLADDAHPSAELARRMSATLYQYVQRRRSNRADLREILEKRRDSQDRTKSGNEEATERQERSRTRDSQDTEDERARLITRESEQLEEARAQRRQKEEEIRSRLERQLHMELDGNEKEYRKRVNKIREEREQAEDRLRDREREAERRRRARSERERSYDESPMRNRDIREDVPRRRDLTH
jgi:hypothetical protein